MVYRVLINAFIFISIFYLPWWVTTIVVLSGVIFFKNFYEAILAGLIIDMIYGAKTVEFANIWFVFTASYTGVYVLSNYLKKNIRLYETN